MDMSDYRTIYHMANQGDWNKAVNKGLYYGSKDDLRDGFIHFSTCDQIKGSAQKHRKGQSDLLLLSARVVDFGEELKWEQSQSSAPFFPHLYSALSVRLVQAVRPLPIGADGLHLFPELER